MDGERSYSRPPIVHSGDQLRIILEHYLHLGYYPSAVCRVFGPEETLFSCTVGDAGDNSWYDLASVSKIVLTTMLLSVMEAEKILPDTPVLRFLPQSTLGPAARSRLDGLSLQQLLTHTSGIVPWFPFYADGFRNRPFLDGLDEVLSTTPKEEGVSYSDLNFMLLAEVLCRCTGLPLREALETFIRCGLHVEEIAYSPVEPSLCVPGCFDNCIEKKMVAERHLTFSDWRPDGVPVLGECNDGNAFYYWGGASGHAGLFATAKALETLCQLYLTTDRPLFLQAMQEHAPGRGLGFDTGPTYPDGCGHSCFTGTGIWISRSRRMGAVLLANRLAFPDGHTTGNMNEVRRAVFYGLAGRTPDL